MNEPWRIALTVVMFAFAGAVLVQGGMAVAGRIRGLGAWPAGSSPSRAGGWNLVLLGLLFTALALGQLTDGVPAVVLGVFAVVVAVAALVRTVSLRRRFGRGPTPGDPPAAAPDPDPSG